MGHQITHSDGAIFFSEPAWHGKGSVLTTAPSPSEALALSGLDWEALKCGEIFVNFPDGGGAVTDDYCAIVRADTSEILSIQGRNYQPIQNREVFDLAYSLGKMVKVESAFSMSGGRRLVVLCRGDSIAPAGCRSDEIHRYLALINSHDGTYTLMVFPTSVRVVCHNTASQAIGEAKRSRRAYSVRHKGDMNRKMEEVEVALRRYRETGDLFQQRVDAMSTRTMTAAEVQDFWLDVYASIYGAIPAQPKTDAEREAREKAYSSVRHWSETFDNERRLLNSGATVWMAANAVTKSIQHGKRRGNSDPNFRAFDNLTGTAQDESMLVFNKALALV